MIIINGAIEGIIDVNMKISTSSFDSYDRNTACRIHRPFVYYIIGTVVDINVVIICDKETVQPDQITRKCFRRIVTFSVPNSNKIEKSINKKTDIFSIDEKTKSG
jgi:hypothetical protein